MYPVLTYTMNYAKCLNILTHLILLKKIYEMDTITNLIS